MKLLSIESSARTCSAAVVEDKKLICEVFSDTGLTHSQTLMQMVNLVLRISKTSLASIDCLSAANGPGSYTGIRIGIAAVKGLAQYSGKKCIGISTLEAMAYNHKGSDCIVCSVMDARCTQVYTALFKCGEDSVIRLTDDTAMSINDLNIMLANLDAAEPVFLIGDGAKMFYETIDKDLSGVRLAPLSIRNQCAYGVALAALHKPPSLFYTAEDLHPFYLRAPQAERELKKGW